MTDDIEALRAELERVEKERDEWKLLAQANNKLAVKQSASMDRARELAEKCAVTNPHSRYSEIARLLSGDE